MSSLIYSQVFKEFKKSLILTNVIMMNFGRIKKEKRLFFILIPFKIVLVHSYRADTIGDTELLI